MAVIDRDLDVLALSLVRRLRSLEVRLEEAAAPAGELAFEAA
jgi:hypothetical protein